MFYRLLPGRTLVAVKRQKNLRDLLCRAKLDNIYKPLPDGPQEDPDPGSTAETQNQGNPPED